MAACPEGSEYLWMQCSKRIITVNAWYLQSGREPRLPWVRISNNAALSALAHIVRCDRPQGWFAHNVKFKENVPTGATAKHP